MIGDFVTRGLVLVLGYAYPAFQCFKTVEKNRVEIQELRFWCQYWIIVAVLTIFERTGDVFISWLPMYGEMKVVLFVYLWYPKIKGTGYVYETFLRPYVAKHERDIDRSLLELKERAWNVAICYWQNCTELSSTKILQFLQFLASQSIRATQTSTQNVENQKNSNGVAPPPTPPTTPSRVSTAPSAVLKKSTSIRQRPPIPPASPSNSFRDRSSKSESSKVHLRNEAQFIRAEDIEVTDSDSEQGPYDGPEEKARTDSHSVFSHARLKLRRTKSKNSN